MDKEQWKENFKDHVATLKDLGNIKVLDFMRPGSSTYRIRFMFEEDFCRLHISGDLGELIATNYYNMTYEKFSDFVNDVGYFETKIDCHNRAIYYYDEDEAREQLREKAKEDEWTACTDMYAWEENESERIEYIITDILRDFEEDTGLGRKGYELLSELDPELWEYTSGLGKKETGILDLYMLAFQLAQENLKEQNKQQEDEEEYEYDD